MEALIEASVVVVETVDAAIEVVAVEEAGLAAERMKKKSGCRAQSLGA